MIIKYYSTDGSLYIIEGVEDVAVPNNPVFGDYALDPRKVFDFEHGNDENDRAPLNPQRIITYVKDGPCMLKVWGVAYICNDDGKTIEKVGF